MSAQTVNALFDLLIDRVASALPGKGGKSEKLIRQFNDDPCRSTIEEWIREPDLSSLYVYWESGEKLAVSLEPAVKKKGLALLKSKQIQDVLKVDDFKTDVICCEITDNPLSNLSLVAHEVFFPLLSNPANRSGWSGPTAKDVMLKFSAFLSNCTMTVGQAQGQTLLPAPPPEAFDEDNLIEKERIHLLETTVLQWANKIQAVLATDPEQAIKQGQCPHPFQELDFWTHKAADLTSLHEQLGSEKMRAVQDTLMEMKSPFGAQFEKLGAEVLAARDEAQENARFLRTLKPYFTILVEGVDFSRLDECFLPLLHSILLIFKHSNTYNTKLRLTCLIQEICNALVSQASRHVSGEILFRTIEEDNPIEGVQMLRQTTQLIEKFKVAFTRYQTKANKELPDSDAWNVENTILFQRVDLFLERCGDISDFLKIVLEFSKLGKIFLGGTKGKQLTQALRNIHEDFVKAVESFKQVPYDIMDISQARFDDDFYRYRCEVKELDRRLAAVLIAGFDDAATLSARFKLLDSFEGLLDRPIIKDELDKKQALLMDSYVADLRHVQEFFHANKSSPRIDQNMPPVAGALAWCRSLTDRIEEPLEKFRQYTAGPGGVEREEVKEIVRVQRSILQQLHEYEQRQILEWSKEIDQSSQEKLRQPLLRRDRESRLLHVNFDDALVRLLREVKYFLLLKIDVPAPALTIFEKSEMYRQQIGNLDQIVNMYNEMMLTLHQVERPLVEKGIAHIDEVIERGMAALNWTSPDVDEFIKQAMETVKDVYKQVKVMKDNLAAIKKMMSEFAAQPLAERKNKPLSPADFEENLRKLWLTRHSLIAEHQETVTKLLLESNHALNVNKGSPIWRAYVEYVQDSVRDGLAAAIINSIKFLCEQLDPSSIEKNGLAPLLEIKLGLYANDVLFNAEDVAGAGPNAAAGAASNLGGLDSVGLGRKSRRDVWQIVSDWVEGFFEIGNIMTRADGSHYVGDLKKNEGIVRFVNTLKKHLDWNQKECESYRQEYIKFDFLWKQDRHAEFQKFLNQSLAEAKAKAAAANPPTTASKREGEATDEEKANAAADEDDDGEKENEEPIGEVLPLDKFEEKILYYREIANEIGEKKSPVEIGWLKVNAQPIKVALNTWVQRWIQTYTSYLYNDVTRKLSQLESLMNEVNTGLLAEVSPGDSAALKKVLGYIHAVRSKEKSTLKLFGPLRDTVMLLKKYGRNLDEYEMKLLSDAPMKWDSTVNNVYKIKEKVNNLQNEEVDKIKAKVESFESELRAFRRDFKQNAPFTYDVDVPEAYDLIYHFHKKINAMEEKAAKLTDLEKVFELNVSKHRQIKKNRQENRLLKGMWDLIAVVQHQFDDWKKTLWDKIDTDALLMACKKLQRQIMQMPVEVQSWECYNGLLGEVKNLLTVLPLVNLLHSPCMEERHWRELKIATGKHFNKDAGFCLSHLLDLELHKYVGEVEYIVELASKESKIAGQLQRIEQQWSGLELQFGTGSKNGVGVIQRPDEILATLEENMAALQGMQGQGKYVEHFIDSVTKWQRLLNQAETVLYDWLEVQSKWSSLEAIFLGSKDIRIQLPEDSERFDELDQDWKELMANAKNTPNVIEACSTNNRSERLQTMKVGLEMCIAAGTPVCLSNGTSIPIEKVTPGQQTFALHVREDGSRAVIPSKVEQVIPRPTRKCVELLFSDGRSLVCTPDHRILTADGEWVEAQHLNVTKVEKHQPRGVHRSVLVTPGSLVSVAPQYPSLNITPAESHWTYTVPGTDCVLDVGANLQRTLAFARILGYVLTDGTVRPLSMTVFLGHDLDVKDVKADILSVTGESATVGWDHSHHYLVLPRRLREMCTAVGLQVGRRSVMVCHYPAFLLDPACPLAVVSSFLGGLFGGDGGTVALSKAHFDLITFSCSKVGSVARAQAQQMVNELFPLLVRCGIPVSHISWNNSTQPPCRQSAAGAALVRNQMEEGLPLSQSVDIFNGVLSQNKVYKLVIRLSHESMATFARHIGFRYCVHKHVRVNAASLYYNGKDFVLQQRARLQAKIGGHVGRGLRAKCDELMRDPGELLHPVNIRWLHTVSAADLKKHSYRMTVGGYDVKDVLEKYDIRKVFSDPRGAYYAGEGYEDYEGARGDRREHKPMSDDDEEEEDEKEEEPKAKSITYGLERHVMELPLFRVEVVGRREIGEREVWDLSVPIGTSFLANGVVVHNCEKSLFQYLETKRKSFPRFYFLSNAALLDLLSFGHDPQAVQKHLGDCFDNVSKLEYTTEPHPTDPTAPPVPTKTAIGMHSKEGEEYVPLASDFHCVGAVEEWLNRLVTAMRSTLMDIMSKAKFTADHWEVDRPRQKWLFDYPAQVALTASQIIWTEEVNSQFEAFGDGNEQAMKEYSKTLASRLESLISLVLGELNARDRTKIITLITVDVHNRDVVQKLIDTKTTDYSAFAWQSQMRMKWKADTKDVIIKVADASFNYSYEYIGNAGRLVITPLTDRCYITLTQALRLIMGGAPAGPAGTGKTETTKDLGRAMGLPVYVFNCSEQMNVQSLGTIFKGLCQTGAWGCFDEFNRIPIEVLSVVSTQVSCILNAIREKRGEFDFMGEIVRLIPSVGIFITMNPGYAGRTELPENLKTLFRSCAMVTPDLDLICENMLMSEGFLQAQRLSKKFTTLYSLSSELLSKQRHYDWGLRAVKAVLRVAGGLKRAEPKVDEDRILMRALRDFNLPKLVDEDKPIFRELIGDLFPGLANTERKFDMKLQEAIVTVAGQRGLQAEETFVLKCVELAELLAIRHSVFVVGPAGCAKTEIWRTLLGAFKLQGLKCAHEVINPKAIRNNELYGWLSKTDWHDGVLSTIMRNMSRCRPPYTEEHKVKWLVLDGDIDPNWIESLNTVMDDNKMLTLVSNERIPLTPSMRMMFEISNLDNATPATVSRAGILYINARDVGSKPFLDSWIEQRENDKEKSSLLALFNKYCTPEFLHEMAQFGRIIQLSEINMIRSLCFLLEGLLGRLADNRRKAKVAGMQGGAAAAGAEENPAVEKEIFESNFVYACIWAFGGATFVDKAADHRKEFSDWWRRVFTTIKFPKEGLVFDYYPDEKTGKMTPWMNVVQEFTPPDDAYLVTKVFVPTQDTVRTHALLDLMVERRRQVLLVGTAGTGKSSIIRQYLRSMNENMMSCTINLNYYTDAKALQHVMEGPIDKRSGRIYGPPGTKRLVYFIDDLNMPYVDMYNTQSPSCLIKQHMDYGSWYDTVKLERKEIQDVQYLAAMNPTAGSFTVDPRLQGLFATFACLLPSKKTLAYIYTSVLQHHFASFGSNIQELVPRLIKATIELHDSVSLKFIPSTRKFHYQFNLRDLSAVFQGVCLAQNGEGYTPHMIVQLWQHESTRVFADRLVSPQDGELFDEILEAKMKQYFKEHIAEPKRGGDDGGNTDRKNHEDQPLIFTSFMNGVSPVYLPVEDMADLKVLLEDKLKLYNDTNPVMNLEMFSLAIQHVCRIARIIENPRGNALLVGVGGSGKQSLAKLASFLCGYDVFQISVTQSYGVPDLRIDLQNLYLKAGVKNMPITFLLTDQQIVDDAWLVYINDLLSSGDIPDLFSAEDKDSILSSVRNEAKAAGVPDNREALHEFFINNVRTNLHVVLCFSPVGDKFRVRCRKFPGLINNTVIDWFHPWPRDALVSVAKRFLLDLNTTMGKSPAGADQDAVRQALAEHMAGVHISVNEASERYRQLERRHNYTTPKSFLELIAFYKTLLNKKRADLAKQTSRLEKGITTLKQTHVQVAALKEDLQKTLVRVGEKAEAATVLIGKMGVERKKVEEQQALAAVEAAKAKTVSEVANKISEECAADLAQALPILERAKNAVDCLSKASLTTLKSFAQPPGNVLYVTNAVMIMKGIPGKRDWGGAKKMMKDIGKFLEELKSFDATQIDEATLKKLQPILEKDFFTEENMKTASEAAANLCAWVVNIVEYNKVYKNVAPKIAAKEKATEEYEIAESKLRVVEERVAAMQAKLKSVTDALKDATDEKNQVEAEAQMCQDRLGLAKRLVEGLADENIRWTKSIASFQEKETTLVGDSMLAAAFVSYIGAFNQKFRKELWKDLWIPDLTERTIPLTPNVDPLLVLASDSDFARWKNEGLAADRASLENGAIITQCSRWPLIIDPQLQGVKWIRQRLAKDLKVISLSGKHWLTTLLNAVSAGDPVLIEGVGEEFDATIDPILSRSIIQRASGSKIIKIGSDEVNYHDDFRLYLQCKLSNPHYKPEIAAQCTIINFIVTEEGLEEQLLALVVNREKPELEERRTALVRAINDYMVSLTDLENELLERLSNAPDDILSDVALIEGLEKTKQASTEIEQKVEQAKKQEVSINTARNEFVLVSSEGAWIYFLLIQLHIIDHMYQFSLHAFISFFMKAMARAKPAELTKDRVVNLRESIRLTVFTWVNRGLFEKHKLIFSSQLCFKLMSKGALKDLYKWDAAQYDYLVRGSRKPGVEKSGQLDWLPSNAWYGIQKLIELSGFEKLASDMLASPNRFKEWYNKPRPEIAPLPLEWRKLDEQAPFMKLLVVRAMRPDRMTIAMENFVKEALPDGTAFIECDAGKSFMDVLSASLDDSTPVNPIFFILSPGADPVHFVEILAKRNGVLSDKLHRVALGQGQDVVAMSRLDIAHKEGGWVVLENIHLMPAWNVELEKKLDDFAAEVSHPDFRLFISAEPSDAIPNGILERSIKLTNEPPQGLKQNLKRAFASFEKDEFEFKDPKVKSIIFGLCHFHSVLVERIKFGAKGWNKLYPFSIGDLMCSATVLNNYLDAGQSADKVPWNDLRYIFGDILYGGHITDNFDRLLCSEYLAFFMREELLDEMEMFPFNEAFPDEHFRSPPVLPYDQYFEYIDHEMKAESPVAFGLHPNAEIAVKTKQANELFTHILDLQPRSSAAAGGDSIQSPQAMVQMMIQQVLNDKAKGIDGINFNLDDIAAAVVDERGPYQNVFLQECERMNILCKEMRRSLKELDLGLSGELQMSERMEELFQSLYLGRVPSSWSRLAYPSQRSFSSWMDNLIARAGQLQSWVEEPAHIPLVVQITYLFNPQSFLTAIMQKTAQKQKLELDKLVIQTDVTRKTVEQTDTRARDGAYIYGLYMEGARWNWNAGLMEECLPREMSCALPVICARAVLVDKQEKSGVYRCPVYKTQRRGDSYVFTAGLRTKAPTAKWCLAGVVLTMEVEE